MHVATLLAFLSLYLYTFAGTVGVTLLEEDEEKGANWELVDRRKGQPKGRQNIY